MKLQIRRTVAEVFVLLLVVVVFYAIVLVPIVAPRAVSSPEGGPLQGILFVLYGSLWLLLAILAIDSAAYIYGFKRPIFVTSARGLRLGRAEPRIRTPKGAVLCSLASYGLTVYCFAVAVSYLSYRDTRAYSEGVLDLSTSLYFSVVTAATVGYGDIYPLSRVARWLAVAEIVTSFLYAVFIFSLVASVVREKAYVVEP